MAAINLYGGWIAILVGLVTGAAIGLFFHDEQWLGGYGSWSRRMLRLAHIACIGTGLLNILFGLSVGNMNDKPLWQVASGFFIAGAITMPSICALSAWRRAVRHLFFIPVLCLLLGTMGFLLGAWLT